MISISAETLIDSQQAYKKIYRDTLLKYGESDIRFMDKKSQLSFCSSVKEAWSEYIFENPIVPYEDGMWSESSEASIKAREMGLTHRGFGKYADKDGDIVYQTLGGKLHKVNSFAHHEALTEAAKKRLHKKVANNVAKEGHEEWRKGWAKKNGGAKNVPRVKTTTDKDYIKKHGTDQVDINTHYKNLPSDAKGENEANGLAVADYIVKTGGQRDAKSIEKGAEIVHNAWMGRNKKEDWNAHLFVPYHKLPEEEKQKDRDMINVGLKHYHR